MIDDDSPYSIIKILGSLTSDGIFIFDLKENDLEYVNHAMVRIFDISHESFRHQPDFFVNHVIPEDIEHLLEEFEHLKQYSAVENVEFRLKSHDQKIKTISCNGYVVDGRAIGFVRDLTAARENEEYIVNFGAKKDALLDMVSHNLSGPLRLTQNILDSMTSVVHKQDTNKIHEHLALVRESTDQCIEIVNDFLEDEHLTSEYISVKRTRFDVLAKINNLLERMRPFYPLKQFVLSTDVLTLYAENDEVKFMQVMQNLLSNATKFTPSNGRVEIVVEQMAKSFSIHVKDNGIGIPDTLKALIFQKYTPAGREGLRGERSIGMGLYIVQKLVSIMNGRLTFESVEGNGSVFTVQFLLD
jgi:two-component system, OmpR family, sensor histidine kinase VicK